MSVKDKFIKLISSFFYLGYSPIIPGTVASFGGLLIYFLVKSNIYLYALILILIGVVGFLITGRAEDLFGEIDCSKIVIDEVAGILVALFLVPAQPPFIVLGFILFRGIDAVKPFPFDRLQKLPGATGIMLDDLGAGLYTNLILQITRILSGL